MKPTARLLAILVSSVGVGGKTLRRDSPSGDELQYDYVIVGGGTAGCVLANWLFENPLVTVALKELGDSVLKNPRVTSLDGVCLGCGTAIDFDYISAPQIYANDNLTAYYAGKALRGSSVLNGECFAAMTSATVLSGRSCLDTRAAELKSTIR